MRQQELFAAKDDVPVHVPARYDCGCMTWVDDPGDGRDWVQLKGVCPECAETKEQKVMRAGG